MLSKIEYELRDVSQTFTIGVFDAPNILVPLIFRDTFQLIFRQMPASKVSSSLNIDHAALTMLAKCPCYLSRTS